jgi:hypothetical protein
MLFKRTRCKGKGKLVLLAYQEGRWGSENIEVHKALFMLQAHKIPLS